MQFITRIIPTAFGIIDSLTIIGVDDKYRSCNVLEIVPPKYTNLVSPANVPYYE